MPPRGSLRRPGPGAAAPSRAPQQPPLPDFLARIAAGDDCFTLSELSAAIEASAPGNAAEVASPDQRKAAQMLALLALALRRSCPVLSPGVDQDLRGAYRKLRSSLAAQLSDPLMQQEACGPHHQLLLGLTLRTHVLRCYSRMLGGAAQQLRGRPSRRNAQAAAEVLTESATLLIALSKVGSCSTSHMAAVECELRESQVLEAWAMAYLQLASLEDRSAEELAAHLWKLVHFMFRADDWVKADLLAGPAMSYLLTMAAVRLAASMDGGGVYGLPADAPELPNLPLSVPLYRGLDADARRVVDTLARLGLRAWAGIDLFGLGNNASKLNLPAIFDVSLRIARGGVAAWLAPPEGTRQQPVARVGQLSMPGDGCGTTVRNALAAASAILRHRAARNKQKASGPRPADTARLRALWAVHVAALEAALWPPEAASDGGGGLGTARQLAPGWDQVVALRLPDMDWRSPSVGLLPAAPGPTADAMLAAGLVSCNERLMRHAHIWPFYGWPVDWMEVLSYGPLPDLAALLVTAAKVVRRTRGACWGQWLKLDIYPFDVQSFSTWAAAGGSDGASGSAGGGGLEPVQPFAQLALLGSLVAARLLPAVAQLLPGQVSCATSADNVPALCVRLAVALQWCELLLMAYASAHERSTHAGAAAGCAAAEAAEWRGLLLRDVGLLGLLGAAARMLGDPSACEGPCGLILSRGFVLTLRLACCALPRELRAALLWEGTEQSAGPSPGGGSTAAAARSSPQVPRPLPPLRMAAVRAVLGPRGTTPAQPALAEVESVVQQEWRQWPCAAEAGPLISETAAAAGLLVPPTRVEALLSAHCCASPACVNLSGRSERALRRVACGGGCGLLRYCGEECRAAHWAAGHSGACRGAAGAAEGAVGAGGDAAFGAAEGVAWAGQGSVGGPSV